MRVRLERVEDLVFLFFHFYRLFRGFFLMLFTILPCPMVCLGFFSNHTATAAFYTYVYIFIYLYVSVYRDIYIHRYRNNL